MLLTLVSYLKVKMTFEKYCKSETGNYRVNQTALKT